LKSLGGLHHGWVKRGLCWPSEPLLGSIGLFGLL
jgi:hypothetical protein